MQSSNPDQLPLDFEHPLCIWPAQEFFPLNLKTDQRTVKDVLLMDMDNSNSFTVVTGFTSLAQIVETFGDDHFDENKKIQIVLGFEPEVRRRKFWRKIQLQQEIKDYWLERGISPFLCGKVIKVIEGIKKGSLTFKSQDHLHAKIYVGETHAILGSANFSNNGLTSQIEANIRVPKLDITPGIDQYSDIKLIADNLYDQASNFNDQMTGLLEELLLVTSWKEALARAIAELLEGNWLKVYSELYHRLDSYSLWPSQMQGIARGLQVLQELGSLLVADPTGSGKTKMITAIQLALVHWLWETGRREYANCAAVAPPLVLENWEEEQYSLDHFLHLPISQGVLSQKQSKKKEKALTVLKKANVLVMDEAHNYLNQRSLRSAALSSHESEHVILSTATPINKNAEDLLRLVELLDPDNLNDSELIDFKELYKNPTKIKEHESEALQKLRSYIWRFTLRRTKAELNELIKKDPEKYRNKRGERCHYPTQNHKVYPTGESPQDIKLAQRINEEASKLKGLIYLQKLNRPKFRDLSTTEKQQNYIFGRLKAASALSKFRIQATLRSSRAALIEHAEGTDKALGELKMKPLNKKSGNIIATLEKIQNKLPTSKFNPDILPKWMTNEEEYQKVCEEEISIYKKISRLAFEMSNAREKTKAKKLLELVEKHGLVLAFDHTVISLYYIANLMNNVQGIEKYVVSGENKTNLENALNDFKLGSTARNVIALCSDSMSEGVNLQQASAVVMLDMPSVLRLAEQRVGRIDRLDSPHKTIHVYWPNDSPDFALKADRKLIRTSRLTKQLLGSNLSLPEEFEENYERIETFTGEKMIKEIKQLQKHEEEEWEGVKDAFHEIQMLKEGKNPLIKETEYEDMKNSRATVRCKLSFVQSGSNWAFLSLRGTKNHAPRWLYIKENGEFFTSFTEICEQLRKNLVDVQQVKPSPDDLESFKKLFRKQELDTLPNKKRRALEVARHLLKKQQANKEYENLKEDSLINELLTWFKPSADDVTIDYSAFARQWLDLLTPMLREKRDSSPRKRKYLTLEDLKSRAKKRYFTYGQLKKIADNIPLTESLDLKIAACIVGVKVKNNVAR